MPPRYTAYLDPAKRRCGIAIFYGQRLEWAGTVACGYEHLPHAVVAQIDTVCGRNGAIIVAEAPQHYKGDREKHGDLDSLNSLLRAIEKIKDTKIRRVSPNRWKGGVSKAATGRRILETLKPSERAQISDTSSDTYDAIGLGLVESGRCGRGVTRRYVVEEA